MKLTQWSTPAEVIVHHPKMIELEDKMLDHNLRDVNPSGSWDQNGAMNRVVLRRHIREVFPENYTVASIVNLDQMDLERLITEEILKALTTS